MYLGDFALGKTFDFFFTTRRFTTGAPFTLAGTPAVAAYEDNGTVEITAGITLTVDFDARTGLNHVRVVATGANGFGTGQNYALVITAGTVDAVSVVGEVIAHFSIEARSALRPTTADRTLDVAVGGEAGVDLDNTVGTLAKGTDITGFNDLSEAQVNAEVDAALDTVIPVTPTAGSINDKVKPLTFTTANQIDARVNSWKGTTPSDLIAGRIDANAQVVADKTNFTIAVGGIPSGAHVVAELNSIADALLDRRLDLGTDSGGNTTTTRTVRQALRASRNRVAIAAGVMSTYKEDDVTVSWTAAITTVAGNPITERDPI